MAKMGKMVGMGMVGHADPGVKVTDLANRVANCSITITRTITITHGLGLRVVNTAIKGGLDD